MIKNILKKEVKTWQAIIIGILIIYAEVSIMAICTFDAILMGVLFAAFIIALSHTKTKDS